MASTRPCAWRGCGHACRPARLPIGHAVRSRPARRHQGAAVGRRVGIVGADDALDLRHDAAGFFLGGGDDGQGANALAVQREVLGERAGGEELQPDWRRHERRRHRLRYRRQSPGRPCRGRAPAAFLADGNHFGPLGVGQVGTRRVVAAGVQDDDRTGIQALQASHHASEVDATRGGVVVR